MDQLSLLNSRFQPAQQDTPSTTLTRLVPGVLETAQDSDSPLHTLARCTPDEVLERILKAEPPRWSGPEPAITAAE